jgi:Domain of unknown function (DUF4304)
MNRSYFLKLLTQQFFPILIEEGFVIAKQNAKRSNNPLVHIVNIQGGKYGNECFINLGAHLVFLPAEGGIDVPFDALQEIECAFRGRLNPPQGQAYGWPYGENEMQAQQTVSHIIDAWQAPENTFFKQYASYPQSFLALINQTNPQMTAIGKLLPFARIALQLNQLQLAKSFAQAGLAKVSKNATNYIANCEEIIKQCT